LRKERGIKKEALGTGGESSGRGKSKMKNDLTDPAFRAASEQEAVEGEKLRKGGREDEKRGLRGRTASSFKNGSLSQNRLQ